MGPARAWTRAKGLPEVQESVLEHAEEGRRSEDLEPQPWYNLIQK